MQKLYEIKLSIDELKRLDGNVNNRAQSVINEAKQENSYGFTLPLMNEVLRKSEEKGELTWRRKPISSCSYCDKKRDYFRYPRSGKYHRKGDLNYSKPKYYSGIKFHEGFVTVKGLGDICLDCCEEHNVLHGMIDHILDNDLKIEIQKNDYKDGKYLKDEVKECYNCEERIRISEMKREWADAIPSICPHCNKNENWTNRHKLTDSFDFLINPRSLIEVQKIKELVRQHNQQADEDDQIVLVQHKRDINTFYVKETKFKNGYRDVIKFSTKEKKYYIGYFWKEKSKDFVEILDDYNETNDEYAFS